MATRADGAVRLPLQIGTSSVWSLARACAALFGGPALTAIAVSVFLERHTSMWLCIPFALTGIFLVVYGWTQFKYALRDRPSDVVLSPQGLHVEGGRYHGLTYDWPVIDAKRCTLDAEKEQRVTLVSVAFTAIIGTVLMAFDSFPEDVARTDVEVLRLRVKHRLREPLVIAEAERPIEKESIKALFESIQAGHWHGVQRPSPPPPPPAPTADAGPGIVACAGCGAAVAPDDEPAVVCAYCGATVEMPDAVRTGVRNSRTIDREKRRAGHLVSRLVEQPGAAFTNTLIALAAIPMMLAWPVAFWTARSWWNVLGYLPLTILLKPALFALSVILAFFFLLRARLADRFALRLLTLGFAARAPEKPGAPYGCRRCGAPLAPVRDTVLAPCVYCGTENVIGVDLGHRAAAESEQAGSLADALLRRSSERRLWSRLSAAAVLVLAFDAWLLWGMPVVRHTVTPVESAGAPSSGDAPAAP